MKNVSKLLALGLVLFLGACTVDQPNPVTPPVTPPTTESKFLDKIKGKTAYDHETSTADTDKIGVFSANGKTFTFSDSPEVLTFVKATDENNGEYDITIDGNKTTLTITTADGKTGSAPEAGNSTTKLWFK